MAYQSHNPYTEAVLKTFEDHSDQDMDSILRLSYRTFRDDWRFRSYADRATILGRAATLLDERRTDFAHLATLEMGKLRREAESEVDLCVRILSYYATNAEAMLASKVIPVESGQAYVETAPIGVIFCIEPWNFPFYQLARVAGPNLMAGNVLVVKHAPNVPQCALAFEKLFLDAGAPAGVYANVFISNEQSAIAIADRRVAGVALTGSERAGSAVAAEAGKALKKSTMELGGSDAFIVLDDADIDLAVKLGMKGRIENAGQVCNAAKRFIIQESIADSFTERFMEEFTKLIPGDPSQDGTSLAPMCSGAALSLALKQIDEAVAAGARVLIGGKRIPRSGYFLEPTLLADVTPQNPAFYQEFFAPVAMLFRVQDESEAIRFANDSLYGLGGTIISANVGRAKRMASLIETGMVCINETGSSAPELPFGGVKNSGFGRELSDLGINEFVNKKLVKVAAPAG
ncbi:NAD-dependent succinate-semialdehyde dehydrogenase (plasmid) [Lichenicola cladoniae]|uniref:NAD-dependent succinate-semialdehyde dehydrogenase n=1 Tax=Lichenicola cladoniae TaxID=1484109 RepID=A0A6M8HZ01_9PROT|nr:NAD-dependent succinate-semialdehyde dehydrogenase [Lichenicola cladoniae]NPD70247.1 NAD-dependent succinate-semialdehyde dehydrogenase [Acetobacteraceae bacterium]QKE93375.1 NAD-dependent succinate-semialdehyde dehydrogenase [Lichenicola cladoniae]